MYHRILTCCFAILLPLGRAEAQAQDPKQESSAEQVRYFERFVRPLLARYCYECHRADSENLGGSLRLDNRESMLVGGGRGPAVVPGKPAESLLVMALSHVDEDLQMPPDERLPDRAVEVIREWVRQGAVMPDQPESFSRRVDQADHWAYQPIRSITPPRTTKRAPAPGNSIDLYIARGYRRQDLQPVAMADKRTLIRRVAFDLHGIPPTADQLQAFQHDAAPDSWSRLVDRYLASPHYGERWGRYWLDLARYTDTTAAWLKSTGRAYLYRDWVIKAWNRDLPYDRFVTYQLAADHHSEARPSDLAALGFLGLSPTYWKEPRLAEDVIKTIVAEEWEERIDTLGRTFLGLTVACARCHDHKFDAISTRDYYALAGVFASTRLADRALLPTQQAESVEAAHREVKRLEAEVESLRKAKKTKQVEQLLAQIVQIKNDTAGFELPLAHGVDDASIYVVADGPELTRIEYRPGEAIDLPVYHRGDPSTPGKIVPRRFLEVFGEKAVSPFENGSGRGDLADAMLRDARDLVARVIVNRVWLHHFGQGLVETPSDFGRQGSRPSHPGLLDALSLGLVEHGWSIKWLQREILCSRTYRLSSGGRESNESRDPENRYLWRMNRRRLDIESWRDAMLMVSGELDASMGGPPASLSDQLNVKRTVYGLVARRELDQMLRMYGFPSPTGHSPQRVVSITPLQQLFVLNSEFMDRRAKALMQRIGPPGNTFSVEHIQKLYGWVFQRKATQKELDAAERFFRSARDAGMADPGPWEQYCQALLSTNEFAFVD